VSERFAQPWGWVITAREKGDIRVASQNEEGLQVVPGQTRELLERTRVLILLSSEAP
jgi:hypothetical protein